MHRLKASLRGHGRVTVRDLLLLVGSTEDPEAYLEKIFGWTFTRGSEFVKGAFAGCIALAVGTAAVLFDKEASGGIVLGVFALVLVVSVVLVALYINHDVSHLHREWLASVALLRRLEPFREPLKAYLAATCEPDHVTSGANVAVTQSKLCAGLTKWESTQSARPSQVGQLLFDVLGPVPTVHYEANENVRTTTREVLVKAKGLLDQPGGQI